MALSWLAATTFAARAWGESPFDRDGAAPSGASSLRIVVLEDADPPPVPPWPLSTGSEGTSLVDYRLAAPAPAAALPVPPVVMAARRTPVPAAAAGNPCAQSHKGVFYANDFSYLADGDAGPCLGDCLKLMPVAGGEYGTLDVGGQLRMRYHHEQGMGQDAADPATTRFEFTNHDFVLTRLRLYTNWKVADNLRIYQEGIFADVSDDDGTYLPRNIDRNYGDFLNLFVDLGVTEDATLRVGRQELLYGAERLISPLDWANTRRTFDGARVLMRG
jgi:hypothetical protein